MRQFRRQRPYPLAAALIAVAAIGFAAATHVVGAGDEETRREAAEKAVELSQLPPGVTPATEHETVLVPAEPEDPNAPAETFADPPKAAPGDEAADMPIPDYLKNPNPYRLSFVTGDYAPPANVKIDPRLLNGLGTSPRGYTYGYVMFEGQIQARKCQALEKLGVVFDTYHTFNSIQAKIPARAIDGLRVSPFVRWVGYAQPEQKVDEFILAKLMEPAKDPTEELAVFVNVFESDLTAQSRPEPIFRNAPVVSTDPREVEMTATVMMSNGEFQRAIEQAGGRVMGYEDAIRTFYVWATRSEIRKLMAFDFIAGMDTAFAPTLDHDRSMRMTNANYMGNLSTHNGKDTTVAICDSGVYHSHRDLSQTYAMGWDFTGESNSGRDDFGHGTHVAGTVIGDGSARSDRRFRGSAPSCGTLPAHPTYRVKLFDQNGQTASNWPNYAITGWFRTTQNYGNFNTTNLKATVVQNSWGNGGRLSTGYYGTDSLSRTVDTYTHTYRQLYVMSAGNMGGSASTQYYRSNRPPSVSKSALSVANLMDYDNATGTKYGNRYPGAAAYSTSKGPTRDGRLKPLVGAPGTWIVSARTNTTTGYTSKRGTSMAAPHVSGIAAGLHDVSSTYRTYPCLSRAKIMASAQPYAGTRTFSTTSEASYYRRGMGTADAYATYYQRNVADGWMSGTAVRTLTRSSNGFYFDITVPTDATRTFFVMTWDEKAPALNATRAVLYNLDLVLDVEPFSSNINAGEYTSRRSTDNVEWYGNVGSITALRGKKVRVKVPFLGKPTSTSEVVRVAVGYHIPRGDYTPSATVSMSAPTMVKPSSTLTASATATVADYRADALYMYLQNGSFAVIDQQHTTRDGRSLNTDTVVSSTDSETDWTLGMVGDYWSSTHRRLTWTLRAPSTSTLYTVGAFARGTGTGLAYGSRTVCVDGLVPNAPSRVSSTTHTPNQWTDNTNFTATWSAASDNGCAGMLGYGAVFSLNACSTTTLQNLGLVTTTSRALPSTSGSRWYFNIRSFDRLSNASTTQCIGPFLIDTSPPTSPTVRIANNAAITRSLAVTLTNLSATEPSNGSGVDRMRFSMDNGTTWSPWEGFAASRPNFNLGLYGGTTNAGTKTVRVQYRDKAGNMSATAADSIRFDPVDVTSVSPNRGPLIGGDTVTVNGAGFIAGRTTVFFNGKAATGVSVTSSTQLTCVTPTNLVWQQVPVRVDVKLYSNLPAYSETRPNAYEYVGGRVLAAGNPSLGVPLPVTFDAPVDPGNAYVGAASFLAGAIPLSPHNPLPLAPDDLFLLTSQNLIPTVFAGLRGNMVAGKATATVTVPNISVATGVSFYMAFLTLGPTKPLGIRTVSSNRKFTIQP